MLRYILYFLLERRCPQLGPYRSISSVFGRLEWLLDAVNRRQLEATPRCPKD